MSFLLDTHTFLWFVTDRPTLSMAAKAIIEDPENSLYLSVASVWEMAIKISIGKLKLPQPFAGFIDEQLQDNDLQLLEIKTAHLDIVVTLPFHHRDPFDRLIIAQAQSEDFTIIGNDATFDQYAVKRAW